MGRPSKKNKLEALEKKFNLAETLVEELDELVAELEAPDSDLSTEVVTGEIVAVDEKVLDISSLRQDFGLVRNNVIKLVNTGQRILDSACVLDIADLKASQLDALANLQATLGNNLKLLMDIYKDIAAIEKSRAGMPVSKPEQTNINNGNVTNNNIVFTGSTSELLTMINAQIEASK